MHETVNALLFLFRLIVISIHNMFYLFGGIYLKILKEEYQLLKIDTDSHTIFINYIHRANNLLESNRNLLL